MGAFISYLHQKHNIQHYFVLAPNLTIYNKLIADFTPNTPQYVFQGIGESEAIHINIFNISKINTEVRGGRAPRKRLSEYPGQSYFDYLSELDDLVLLMDESHR